MRIVQQVGGSFGAAVLTFILAHELLKHTVPAAATAVAFNTAFRWAIAFTVVALLPALLLPGSLKVRRREAGSPTARAHGAAS